MEPPLPRAGAAAILCSNPAFTARLRCRDLRGSRAAGKGCSAEGGLVLRYYNFVIFIFFFFSVEGERRRDAELRK